MDFGLKTLDIVKYAVLISFIFYFIRIVNLGISSIKNTKQKKDLIRLFTATEIFIWSAFAIWIFYVLPHNKLLFFLYSVLFMGLNIIIWIKIRQFVAYFIIKIAYSIVEGSLIKIENTNYIIKKLEPIELIIKNIENNEILKISDYKDFMKKELYVAHRKLIKAPLDSKISSYSDKELREKLKEYGFDKDSYVRYLKKDNFIYIDISAFSDKNIKLIAELIHDLNEVD